MLRLRHEGWRRADREVVMVRVRLMGLPKEVRRIADAMELTGCVIERSEEYPNRGSSRNVRVYLECDLPENMTAEIGSGKQA